MKGIGGPGMTTMLSGVNDALVRQVKLLLIIFAGLAVLVLLFSAVRSPSGQTWLLISGNTEGKQGFAEQDYNSTTVEPSDINPTAAKPSDIDSTAAKPSGINSTTANLSTTRDAEKNWNTWTTRAAEWEIRGAVQDEEGKKEDQNWAGRQMMRKQRGDGALWWDERAEQYFISKLEKSQFPTNCSQAHWIAHYDFVAGLLSSVHLFQLPLFFAMLRGHTLVPISEPKKHPAFDGCGPNLTDRNMQCFFNVTSCIPGEDLSRLSQILAPDMQHDRLRTTWEEVLMEEDDFFPQGGLTVIQTFKQKTWATNVCVGTSVFSSFPEAYNYHKFSLWKEMGRHGRAGVVTGGSAGRTTKKCSGGEKESKSRRADMVMTSLMSSWMLNQMPNHVKLVADEIMSRYLDAAGKPLWQPPVLAIHVRQTDKSVEDPYFIEHGAYRPIENYAQHMKDMEEQYGFRWPSIFLISDSGTARETLVGLINGDNSTVAPGNSSTSMGQDKRFIMYDWSEDDHLQEKFKDHTHVPKPLKHDMQIHFLASLYILQKIADHAIVTYSSNVGRFIGEIMTAKHRLAFTDRQGPLVTSLDYPWFWA